MLFYVPSIVMLLIIIFETNQIYTKIRASQMVQW